MEAENISVNQREKKEKISRRWTQIEDTQMEAEKIRVNLREKKKISRRWAQILDTQMEAENISVNQREKKKKISRRWAQHKSA